MCAAPRPCVHVRAASDVRGTQACLRPVCACCAMRTAQRAVRQLGGGPGGACGLRGRGGGRAATGAAASSAARARAAAQRTHRRRQRRWQRRLWTWHARCTICVCLPSARGRWRGRRGGGHGDRRRGGVRGGGGGGAVGQPGRVRPHARGAAGVRGVLQVRGAREGSTLGRGESELEVRRPLLPCMRMLPVSRAVTNALRDSGVCLRARVRQVAAAGRGGRRGARAVSARFRRGVDARGAGVRGRVAVDDTRT
jgi:hypothetical protein